MTAEVAILNKTGVALAADSTVTITTANGDKTYNTTNKLFSLSKFHPVGIMIFNATEYNGIPLELIIKEFRETLGAKNMPTVQAFALAFIRHLKTKAHVTKEDQKATFEGIMVDFCRAIRKEFREGCRNGAIPINEPKLTGEARDYFTTVLDNLQRNVVEAAENENFKGLSAAKLEQTYKGIARGVVSRFFARIMPSPKQIKRFTELLHRAALSNYMSDDFSGIVFSGYGSTEYYPTILSYEVDGMFAGRIKLVAREPMTVSRRHPSCLAPFAQRKAATLFMEGVDDDYQEAVDRSAIDLITGIADRAAKAFNVTNATDVAGFRRELEQTATGYLQQMNALRQREAQSVLRAIRVLDKAEMAVLAENMVSLTALKQKISLETETVGGPIDVAFISKNDGFIWIKRKHYFDPALNPFFFKKYLNGNEA